jgi:hypothetical protein
MLMGEKKCVCKNSSCKRTFTAPLKTLNLQETPTEPYYACPFCLIKIDDPTLRIQENEKPAEKPAQKPPATETQTRQNAAKSGKPQNCRFHLGYLSERKEKEQIPDDCLICRDIVECMLKKMHENQ